MHQCDRFALGKISPPAGRDRPQPEANLAHREIGVLVGSETHDNKIKRSTSNAQ
jgi:hypothetical protein